MFSMLLFDMPNFASAETWVALLMLTFLEIVLGVDNIIFISIAANKLKDEEQSKARNIGMSLAMIFRIILLFGITYLIAMQNPVISFDYGWIHGGFTGQSLILLAGGFFLLYKSTTEIHHKLEGGEVHLDENGNNAGNAVKSVGNVITQIAMINIVFSFDSILTAIGLTDNLPIMIISVVISMIIMMLFMGPVGRFVNKHPTIQMLGLAFLILIGFMLVAEGAHLAHFEVMDQSIGVVPKGYLYFAIAFSLAVEFLNMKLRKKQKPIQLHGYQEEAIQEGIIKDNEA